MNEKYDIERILMKTHNRFLMQPGFEDTRPCQYQIYFQFADKPDQYYVIRAEQDARAELWKISGHSIEDDFLEGELMEDPDVLAIDSPDLGKVFVKFNHRVIKEYADYDEFREDTGY
ncbi:MAG: hypothetical protein ACOC5U_02400 [Candidatus Aminicenantaceae bacterium]